MNSVYCDENPTWDDEGAPPWAGDQDDMPETPATADDLDNTSPDEPSPTEPPNPN